MLQIILVVITMSAAGDRKTTGMEFENLESCYAAAAQLMETIANDFDNMGFLQASAGCLVRVKAKPA